MPLLQTTLKPVRTLRSTDTDAPQLSATIGSLKTVLKACLITGYGSTASLGWTMPFEDDEAAAFHSADATATGCHIKVHHDRDRACKITGYKTMTSLTEGQGEYINNNGNFHTHMSVATTAEWVLIGHEKAFVFIIVNAMTGSTTTTSKCLFFGDFPSYAAGDQLNSLLWHTGSAYIYDYIYTNKADYLPILVVNNQAYKFALAGSTDQLTANAGAMVQSRCMTQERSRRNYPDPITNGLQADYMDLHELIGTQPYLRGIHPGLLYSIHNLSQIVDGTVIDGFDDTTDRFLKFSVYYSGSISHHFLVNVSNWVA